MTHKTRLGIGVLLRWLMKKPISGKISPEDSLHQENFRGSVFFNGDKCTGCRLCEKLCPVSALKITVVGNGYPVQYCCKMDMARCILCHDCVLGCPRHCFTGGSDIPSPETEQDKLLLQME